MVLGIAAAFGPVMCSFVSPAMPSLVGALAVDCEVAASCQQPHLIGFGPLLSGLPAERERSVQLPDALNFLGVLFVGVVQ